MTRRIFATKISKPEVLILKLCVSGPDKVLFYQVKNSTCLIKVAREHAKRVNIPLENLIFIYKHYNLCYNKKELDYKDIRPFDMSMKNGDFISVVVKPIAGSKCPYCGDEKK